MSWSTRFPVTLEDIYTQQFSLTGTAGGPLSGLRLAVKDLYNVAGQVTLASQRSRADSMPAMAHADLVQRFIDAGATLQGHTISTQQAFSVIGQNPDYGESKSLWSPDDQPRIAGGSTRGGALAVVADLADIALGTDTGGSCRVPAACNGLVGFKFSHSLNLLTGCAPLSETLDSAGLMAKNLSELNRAMSCVLGAPHSLPEATTNFLVPEFVLEQCDDEVRTAFDGYVDQLKSLGHSVQIDPTESAQRYLALLKHPSIPSIESARRLSSEQLAQISDPRVLMRIHAGLELSEGQVNTVYRLRSELVDQFNAEFSEATLLMPTLPVMPPRLSEVSSDRGFAQTNALLLKNAAFLNLVDGCGISLPIATDRPISVTLGRAGGQDNALLQQANRIRLQLNSLS